jgi:hypothetical protein
MMAGALAGSVMAGTANAGPIIFTTATGITGISQAQQAGSSDPVVTVKISVTAGGGTSAPTGKAGVSVAGHWQNCHAALTSSSGLTSTGTCELRDLAPGSYTLRASYPGAVQLGKSVSANHGLTVSRPGRSTTVATHLSCPAAVNAGQSGNCKLTVTGKGWGTAVNVVAKIALPSALRARYCGDWWWNRGCSLRDNVATWHLGNLRAWQDKSLNVHFMAVNSRSRHSSLVTVTASATWGATFPGQGPMQHISISKYRVEIRPHGFVF